MDGDEEEQADNSKTGSQTDINQLNHFQKNYSTKQLNFGDDISEYVDNATSVLHGLRGITHAANSQDVNFPMKNEASKVEVATVSPTSKASIAK